MTKNLARKMNSRKDDILISIIIPVHNVESYLKECIDSVISQSYSNLEIILINDDSTDRSSRIIKEYKIQDKRIKSYLVREHNAALARRFGIKKANGSYICFLDSDDVVHTEYVSSLFKMLVKYKVSIASVKIGNFKDGTKYSDINYVDTGKTVLENDMLGYFSNNYHSSEVSRQIPQSINAKIFKKEVLNVIDYSILETSVLEDNYIVPQILASMHGSSIALQDRTLYYYRINSGSTMSKTLNSDSRYGQEKMTYPEFFEVTMDYVKNVFKYDNRAEYLIDKVRAQQYLNLTKHIFHQNKSIDKLKNQLEEADSRVKLLQAALDRVTDEKFALEASIGYKVGSRLVTLLRPFKIFIKHLNESEDSSKREKR